MQWKLLIVTNDGTSSFILIHKISAQTVCLIKSYIKLNQEIKMYTSKRLSSQKVPYFGQKYAPALIFSTHQIWTRCIIAAIFHHLATLSKRVLVVAIRLWTRGHSFVKRSQTNCQWKKLITFLILKQSISNFRSLVLISIRMIPASFSKILSSKVAKRQILIFWPFFSEHVYSYFQIFQGHYILLRSVIRHTCFVVKLHYEWVSLKCCCHLIG